MRWAVRSVVPQSVRERSGERYRHLGLGTRRVEWLCDVDCSAAVPDEDVEALPTVTGVPGGRACDTLRESGRCERHPGVYV
eukprot:391312-Prymnesium_polylepis.1